MKFFILPVSNTNVCIVYICYVSGRNNKKIHSSSDVESKTMQMLSNISAVVKPLGPAPFPCMLSVDMDFHFHRPNNGELLLISSHNHHTSITHGMME